MAPHVVLTFSGPAPYYMHLFAVGANVVRNRAMGTARHNAKLYGGVMAREKR